VYEQSGAFGTFPSFVSSSYVAELVDWWCVTVTECYYKRAAIADGVT